MEQVFYFYTHVFVLGYLGFITILHGLAGRVGGPAPKDFLIEMPVFL